jgi:hypothetical protein
MIVLLTLSNAKTNFGLGGFMFIKCAVSLIFGSVGHTRTLERGIVPVYVEFKSGFMSPVRLDTPFVTSLSHSTYCTAASYENLKSFAQKESMHWTYSAQRTLKDTVLFPNVRAQQDESEQSLGHCQSTQLPWKSVLNVVGAPMVPVKVAVSELTVFEGTRVRCVVLVGVFDFVVLGDGEPAFVDLMTTMGVD